MEFRSCKMPSDVNNREMALVRRGVRYHIYWHSGMQKVSNTRMAKRNLKALKSCRFRYAQHRTDVGDDTSGVYQKSSQTSNHR